jgi:hypothetical protein
MPLSSRTHDEKTFSYQLIFSELKCSLQNKKTAMRKNSALVLAATLLLLLGIYMIYLGSKGKILPPTITGVGFLIIAYAFLSLRNK